MFKKSFARRRPKVKSSQREFEVERKILSPNLMENIESIIQSFVHTGDLGQRKIDRVGTLLYLESLVNQDKIEKNIIKGLSQPDQFLSDSQTVPHLDDVITKLLNGFSILLIENYEMAYFFNTAGFTDRAIQEPSSEHIIRGSHEGFIENLSTNIQLVRRQAKNEKLVVKYMELGERAAAVDWNQTYPTIEINPKIETEIVETGIIK